MTATYRSSSNFLNKYEAEAEMTWELNKNFDINTDFLQNRSEFAAAIISNRDDISGRLDLIKELQKYIPVHVYGLGGDRLCPDKKIRGLG